eukprot:Skav215266  [mRNA]  locus=scaffold2881:90620:94915:- [translate_table: standard]
MEPWAARCSARLNSRWLLLVDLKLGLTKPSLTELPCKAFTMGFRSWPSSAAQESVRPGIRENVDWLVVRE